MVSSSTPAASPSVPLSDFQRTIKVTSALPSSPSSISSPKLSSNRVTTGSWSYEIKATSSQITQEALARIVEEVAKHDAEAPSEETPDALRMVKESLTWAWWPLEGMWLQTRDYTHMGAKKKDVIR